MKILHIVPSYKPAYVYGGPIESVAKLCEGSVLAGNIVHVFTTTANGNVELDVQPNVPVMVEGVEVTYFTRITKDHTHISPKLWRHLSKHCKEYDIIHIHSWWNILVIVASWICHLSKVKVIISPRGMLSNYVLTSKNSRAKKMLHCLGGKKALEKSYFHATAQSEYDECLALIPNWKGFLLPNILTLPDIPIQDSKNEVFTLIFLSRIHPKKGIELLLEALSEVKFPVKLKIAGSGEDDYLDFLKKRVQELNLGHVVEWLGWMNRESKFLELMNSDLFVLTSYNENFANVVVESIYMGTPVLISDQVGLATFVKEKNVGWVSSLAINAIKQCLEESYNDVKKRDLTRAQGRMYINESFSETILIAKYVSGYKKLINS